jgi:hypothetical protein
LNDESAHVDAIIRTAIEGFPVVSKSGNALHLHLRVALAASGLDVDFEDSQGFLRAGESVWRDKHSGRVAATHGRRRIDLVLRDGGRVIALVETESDLNDLRESGASNRSGNYDVYSIARNAAGAWFDSYKSLERMGAAAFYAAGGTQSDLERLASDDPDDHNPAGLGIFIVTGLSRARDRRILAPRLSALGARLLSVLERP